jgi:16S rRNA (guanine1207-N2)-methyltransferase
MAHYFTNDNNKIEKLKKVNVNINDVKYYFYTDNGVFSKGELDFGTELLLKTFEYSYPQDKKVLDIGCGCGPIGIYLSKLGFAVDMCDVNLKAVELSKKAINEQNLKSNVFESDAYLNVNNKYDYIISNPPIRVGKQKLYEIVMKARDYLQDEGEVWLVVRKDKGAESLVRDMKKVYSIVEAVEKKKGFHIIKACK